MKVCHGPSHCCLVDHLILLPYAFVHSFPPPVITDGANSIMSLLRLCAATGATLPLQHLTRTALTLSVGLFLSTIFTAFLCFFLLERHVTRCVRDLKSACDEIYSRKSASLATMRASGSGPHE